MVAIGLLPGYYSLGPLFKAAMIPYVLYLVASGRVAHFPALLLHFLPGTLVSQVVLVGCGLRSLLAWDRLRLSHVRWLFLLVVFPLPILVLASLSRASTRGLSIIDIGVDLALYLGLLGFFYGVSIAHQVDGPVLKRVVFVLLFSLLLHATGLLEGTVRYYFLALPMLTTISVTALLRMRTFYLPYVILLSPLLFPLLVYVGRVQLTFTLLAVTIVASALVITRLLSQGAFRSMPAGRVLTAVAIAVMLYVMSGVESAGSGQGLVGRSDNALSLDGLIASIEFKAFGDRGTLWIGAWDAVLRSSSLWPPIDIPPIRYQTLDGAVMEVSFGAHNIGLELLRVYGFLVGGVALLSYLVMASCVGRIFICRGVPQLVMIAGAVTLSTMVVGGLVGHFVLANNFSFLLTALAGIVYGWTVRDRGFDAPGLGGPVTIPTSVAALAGHSATGHVDP